MAFGTAHSRFVADAGCSVSIVFCGSTVFTGGLVSCFWATDAGASVGGFASSGGGVTVGCSFTSSLSPASDRSKLISAASCPAPVPLMPLNERPIPVIIRILINRDIKNGRK